MSEYSEYADLVHSFLTDVAENAPDIDHLSNKIVLTAVDQMKNLISNRKRILRDEIMVEDFNMMYDESCTSREDKLKRHRTRVNWLIVANVKVIEKCVLKGNWFLSMTSSFNARNQNKNRVSQHNVPFKSGNNMSATDMKNKNSTRFQRLEGSKQNSSLLSLGQIKRNIQEKIRNSDALKFPSDAIGFLCPVDTKEMKGTGENVFLTRFTYPAREVEPALVLEVLKNSTYLYERRNYANCLKKKKKDSRLYSLCWNNSLTRFTLLKNDIVPLIEELKHKCVSVSFYEYKRSRCLNMYTLGGNLVKYSDLYRMYLSPFEVKTYFKDAFDVLNRQDSLPYNQMSAFSLYLPANVYKALPGKTAVSLVNIKGRCAELECRLMTRLYDNSTGTKSRKVFRVPGTDGVEAMHSSTPATMAERMMYTKLVESPYRRDELPEPVKLLFEKMKDFKIFSGEHNETTPNTLCSVMNGGKPALQRGLSMWLDREDPYSFCACVPIVQANLQYEKTSPDTEGVRKASTFVRHRRKYLYRFVHRGSVEFYCQRTHR